MIRMNRIITLVVTNPEKYKLIQPPHQHHGHHGGQVPFQHLGHHAGGEIRVPQGIKAGKIEEDERSPPRIHHRVVRWGGPLSALLELASLLV